MELIPQLLPEKCYGADSRFTPGGAVVHFVSGRDAWKIFPELKKGTYDVFDVSLIRRVLAYYGDSYHIFIDRAGLAYQFAPLDRPAWHAGASRLAGRRSCNFWCYGIAFASTGQPVDGAPAYTDRQILVGQRIVAELMSRDGFGVATIGGHDQVRAAAIAAGAKAKAKPDPGPLFPWQGFLAPLRQVVSQQEALCES